MEIRQIQLFVALAEEKSFTKAAKRMHIVQSGMSNSLKELEQDLGVVLCERNTRKVTLTASGQTFLEHARASLSALNDARSSVHSGSAEVRGQLSIGILGCCSPYIAIADVLDRFRKTFRQVEVRLRSLDNNEVVDSVRSGEVNVSFYAITGRNLPPGLDFLHFREDSLLAVCSAGHPIAASQTVSLERLSQEPFIDASREKALRSLVDQCFRKAGLKRRAAFEVDNPMLGIDLVEQNLGVTIMQAAVAEKFGTNRHIRLLPLYGTRSRSPSWRLGLLRKRHSKAVCSTGPLDHFVNMVLPHASDSAAFE